MGSFAKKLGQLTARSIESESANILRTGAANKVPGSLSLALDGTLRKGHDMRIFGLGTMASMADRPRYARFTTSMLAVYSAMEEELEASTKAGSAVAQLWKRHGSTLQRASALRTDLADVVDDVDAEIAKISPATSRYVAGVRSAGSDDRATGGARLLGHVYCRYFADLFGGQMLAAPYNLALSLPVDAPRHYSFKFPPSDKPGGSGRRALIEEVYSDINVVGQMLSDDAFQAVVEEALQAFKFNVGVYSEEPIIIDAVRGTINMGSGFAARTMGLRH